MDEEKIVLIGNESDLLHSGYNKSIKDGGKRYPSATHYTHFQILLSLGVNETIAEELLCTPSSEVHQEALKLLQKNMPEGHDMNSLGSYLTTSLHSYALQSLRLRSEQDTDFEKTLMKTNEALLIVCDEKNRQLGIGMDDKTFMEWMNKEKADSRQIAYWMRNEHTKPQDLGQNSLGRWLMWLRYEIREKRKAAVLSRPIVSVEGLSTDKDDKPVMISINDLIISLEGIFHPLSNYYAFPFEMKGERYRSVEHYAYEKLFNSLKLDDKAIEKIQTTPVPLNVPLVAAKVLKSLDIKPETISEKTPKMDRWRQSAMKHKVYHNEYLQQLLLSTGSAILIDSSFGDPLWTCGATEVELQHLLTKSYVTPERIVSWMLGNGAGGKTPRSVEHLYGNKAGLLLMELREKLAAHTTSRIPLISSSQVSPQTTAPLSAIVTSNVICFTPESVFHPLYPAEIRCSADGPPLASPAHYVATQAAKFLNMNAEDTGYILEGTSSLECWSRLHEVIEQRGRGLELEQTWWMDKRMQFIKESLQLLLDQHPALLRALLDTGDALLVYCSRFSSMDAELSVGMREMDLRVWLSEVDVTTKQLIDLCTRPMAFRPPYLGGNRLGLILMELRREFVLQGVFPQQLPELQLTADSILGTDSPTENFMTSERFDILQPWNYTALWINPLFLLAKDGNPEAIAVCSRVKIAPRMVTVDDEKITEIVEKLVKDSKHGDSLNSIAPEDLRAVFMKLCTRLRGKIDCLERQSMEMSMVAWETHRLQSIRRSLNETKERGDADAHISSSGASISAPPVPSRMMMMMSSSSGAGGHHQQHHHHQPHQHHNHHHSSHHHNDHRYHSSSSSSSRMAAGRDRERDGEDRRGGGRQTMPPPLIPPTSSASQPPPPPLAARKQERMEYKIPTNAKRKFGKDREKTTTTTTTSSASTTTTLVTRREKFQETKKRPHPTSPQQARKSQPPPPPAKKPAPPPPAAPIVPKPKRNPDEELSDGEILSTDEEDNN